MPSSDDDSSLDSEDDYAQVVETSVTNNSLSKRLSSPGRSRQTNNLSLSLFISHHPLRAWLLRKQTLPEAADADRRREGSGNCLRGATSFEGTPTKR